MKMREWLMNYIAKNGKMTVYPEAVVGDGKCEYFYRCCEHAIYDYCDEELDYHKPDWQNKYFFTDMRRRLCDQILRDFRRKFGKWEVIPVWYRMYKREKKIEKILNRK